jgi:hypothetical protein
MHNDSPCTLCGRLCVRLLLTLLLLLKTLEVQLLLMILRLPILRILRMGFLRRVRHVVLIGLGNRAGLVKYRCEHVRGQRAAGYAWGRSHPWAMHAARQRTHAATQDGSESVQRVTGCCGRPVSEPPVTDDGGGIPDCVMLSYLEGGRFLVRSLKRRGTW